MYTQQIFSREQVVKIIAATIMATPKVGKDIFKGENLGDRATNVLKAWDSTCGSIDEFTTVATNRAIKRV